MSFGTFAIALTDFSSRFNVNVTLMAVLVGMLFVSTSYLPKISYSTFLDRIVQGSFVVLTLVNIENLIVYMIYRGSVNDLNQQQVVPMAHYQLLKNADFIVYGIGFAAYILILGYFSVPVWSHKRIEDEMVLVRERGVEKMKPAYMTLEEQNKFIFRGRQKPKKMTKISSGFITSNNSEDDLKINVE